MYKNNGTLKICDDALYVFRAYSMSTVRTKILAENGIYRFIKNPFGGVDFYKVDRESNVFPIGKNLHKKTIKRFLIKYNEEETPWNILYPEELNLPQTINICGKRYERSKSLNQLYFESMVVKS